MKRYNVQTHPKLRQICCESRALHFTKHASERAIQKQVFVPSSIEIHAGEVVELEVEGNKATKLVVRRALNVTHDFVLVLVPRNANSWTVVTCWLNKKTDTHSTLDTGRLSA